MKKRFGAEDELTDRFTNFGENQGKMFGAEDELTDRFTNFGENLVNRPLLAKMVRSDNSISGGVGPSDERGAAHVGYTPDGCCRV